MAEGISSHLPDMTVIPRISDDLAGRTRNTRSLNKRIVPGVLSMVSVLGVLWRGLFSSATFSGGNFAGHADGIAGIDGSFGPQRSVELTSLEVGRMGVAGIHRLLFCFYKFAVFHGPAP